MRTTKYKCDRCGSEFDCSPDDYAYTRKLTRFIGNKAEKISVKTLVSCEYFGNEEKLDNKTVGVTLVTNYSLKEHNYDLCPACARELKRFLENKI